MIRLVTDYLEKACQEKPNKAAYIDDNKSVTFRELRDDAMKIATHFINMEYFKKPIAIFLDKGVDVLVSFLGCAYSGNFYSPIDPQMPINRVKSIIETLEPICIVTSAKYAEVIREISTDVSIVIYDDIADDKQEVLVKQRGREIVDTDILYVLFTSGSTGTPKGVIISHRAVSAYIEWAAGAFEFSEKEILGNQTPFYFSMSVLDIYLTLRNMLTMYIIPKTLFSTPDRLLEYVVKREISMIYWVPSALMLVANAGALERQDVSCIKKVLFAGEVMPTKQLNVWRSHLKNAMYANLYGPTEVTDICTYYIVDRDFDDDEALPIGYPCENSDVILLDEKNECISREQIDEMGELCVRGSTLAYGYYNDSKRTEEAFVQNPLNKSYSEKIYRTGDLVKYNSRGELLYAGRKDFQIKVSGYRIELGEIETIISGVEEVRSCCCLFDEVNQLIICVYEGAIEKSGIRKCVKDALPRYMMPHRYIRLDNMPLNDNGKIHRAALKEKYVKNSNDV